MARKVETFETKQIPLQSLLQPPLGIHYLISCWNFVDPPFNPRFISIFFKQKKEPEPCKIKASDTFLPNRRDRI